jgi:hypothetical protein
MNEKIIFKVNLNKVPKEKAVERRYMNKAGHEEIENNVEFEAVPTKEKKKIKEGATWELWKTHFITIKQTAEERANRARGIIVGDGLMFLDRKPENENQDVEYPENTLEESPF